MDMLWVRFVTLVLILTLTSAPYAVGDNKPPIGGVEDPSGQCDECTYSRYADSITCNPDPAGEWKNCVGGWLLLCDGTGACTREPNCGKDRCLWV
jgi:hypothetical protein